MEGGWVRTRDEADLGSARLPRPRPGGSARVAVVMGWDDEVTARIEGIADFPTGADLERIRACCFAVHPDARERLSWPGITHVRVRPTWLRLGDFKPNPPSVTEPTGQARVTRVETASTSVVLTMRPCHQAGTVPPKAEGRVRGPRCSGRRHVNRTLI